MELVISVDESYYTADELAEFTEPRITRCRDCRWLGRESIVPGEYRCERTERVTTLDDYCSKAVRRDAD